MALNNHNYLKEVKHVQDLVKEKMREHRYINYKQIWTLLVEEKKFFKTYITFLSYMGEPNVNTRIEAFEAEKEKKNNQLSIFDDESE